MFDGLGQVLLQYGYEVIQWSSLASLEPEPDGRARASFWVGPGLAYLVRTTAHRS